MRNPNPLCTLALALLLPFAASAQPSISGSLSGSLGPGTYLVTGDCQVSSGNTLTIAPGTTFLHTGYFTWYISGELNAAGTESQPIQFLQQNSNLWGGLRFQGGSAGNLLEWCTISYCKNVDFPNYVGGAIYAYGSSLTMRHCTISNCEASSGGGIEINTASDIELDHCTIEDCTAGNGGGIYLFYADNVQITHCIIKNNSATST
jgi:parallel beta-helix repeat protein